MFNFLGVVALTIPACVSTRAANAFAGRFAHAAYAVQTACATDVSTSTRFAAARNAIVARLAITGDATRDAAAVLTHFTRRVATDALTEVLAAPVETRLTKRAIDAFTAIDTTAVSTKATFGALDIHASAPNAVATLADKSAWAKTLAAKRSAAAGNATALRAIVALIDLTVAVIVESIAAFGSRFLQSDARRAIELTRACARAAHAEAPGIAHFARADALLRRVR